MIFALIFGIGVLWGAIELEKVLFVWWDQINQSVDTVQTQKKQSKSKQPLTPSFPKGAWDTIPEPDRYLREVIKQIERNEKRYRNLKMSVNTEELIEAKEYSLEGNNWSEDRNYVFLRRLYLEQKIQKSQQEIEEKLRLHKRRIPREEFDEELYEKINQSIKERVRLLRFQSRRDFYHQEGKYREYTVRYPYEIYAFPQQKENKYRPLSWEDYSLYVFKQSVNQENLLVRDTDDKKWKLSYYDGVGYWRAADDYFSRKTQYYDVRNSLGPLKHRPLYELFGGGSRVVNRFQDLFRKEGVSPQYFSDTRYVGTDVVNDEPVVVLKSKTWSTSSPEKVYTTEKLYFAVEKNYLLIKQETNFENFAFLNRERTVQSFQEIEEGVWFPRLVFEYDETYHPRRSGGYMEGGYSKFLADGHEFRALGGCRRVLEYDAVSLNNTAPESDISEIPHLGEEDAHFERVAQEFVQYVIAGKDQLAKKLIKPDGPSDQILDSIKSFPLNGMEISKAEYLFRKEIAAVRYPIFKAEEDRIPLTYFIILLRKGDDSQWKVDSCELNQSLNLVRVIYQAEQRSKVESEVINPQKSRGL